MRDDLSRFDDDIESIFIEIERDQNGCHKNIVIGVIYHPPNQDLKCCSLLGDYDINLLNYDQHVPPGELLDMLSSNGCLPLITRPTRVTPTCATLIDNIFTNNIADISHCMQGLLVTDV